MTQSYNNTAQSANQKSVSNHKDTLEFSSELIKDVLNRATDILSICYAFIPGGKPKSGNYIVSNPCRDDKHPSFSISLKTGAARDFATDDKCRDIVSTIKFCGGYATQLDAALALAQWLGMDVKRGAAPDANIIKKRQAEAAAREAAAAAEAAKVQKTTANIAAALVAAGRDVANHAYLERKQVSATGLKIIPLAAALKITGKKYLPSAKGNLDGDLLIAPLYRAGALTTVELIDGEGRKHFLSGSGTTVGAEWIPAAFAGNDVFHIAEGVATALSVAMSGAVNVSAAMSLSNIRNIVEARRAQYSAAKIVICADLKKGTAAADKSIIDLAQEFGCFVAIPLNLKSGTDFNDLHVQSGLDAVRDSINAAIEYNVVDYTPAPAPASLPTDLHQCLIALVESDCDANEFAKNIYKSQVWRCPKDYDYIGLAEKIINAPADFVNDAAIASELAPALIDAAIELADRADQAQKAAFGRGKKTEKATAKELHSAAMKARKDAVKAISRVELTAPLGKSAESIQIDAKALISLAKWYERKARRLALETITVDAGKLPKNCVVRYAKSPTEIRNRIKNEFNSKGIHLTKAPQGIGKTKDLVVPFAAEFENITSINPIKSLVADNARKMGLTSYLERELTNKIAICTPSITGQRFESVLNATQYLPLDECARIVNECHLKGGHIDNAEAVWNRLIEIVKIADLVIAPDADWCTQDLTIFANALQNEIINIWVIEEPADCGRTLVIHEGGIAETQRIATEALNSGSKVLYVADSAARIVGLSDLFRTEFPDYAADFVEIDSDETVGTTGNQDVINILKNLDAHLTSNKPMGLLISPAVSTGTSIETRGYFDVCIAECAGHIPPKVFNQLLLRYRDGKEWNFAFDGHGVQYLPDSNAADLVVSLGANKRSLELQSDFTIKISDISQFDVDTCIVTAAQNQAINRYAADLYFLLQARGWKIRRQGKCAIDNSSVVAARNARREKIQKAIAAADEIDLTQYKELECAHSLDQNELASKRRYEARLATGLNAFSVGSIAAKEITADDVNLFQDGKLIAQNRWYDDFTLPITESLESDIADHKFDQSTPSLKKFRAPRRNALQSLINRLGFSIEDDGKWCGVVTADSVSNTVNAMIESKDDAVDVLILHGLQLKKLSSNNAIKWLNALLKRGGLKLQEHAQASSSRSYEIAATGEISATGIVRLPGAGQMFEIQQRRLAIYAAQKKVTGDACAPDVDPLPEMPQGVVNMSVKGNRLVFPSDSSQTTKLEKADVSNSNYKKSAFESFVTDLPVAEPELPELPEPVAENIANRQSRYWDALLADDDLAAAWYFGIAV